MSNTSREAFEAWIRTPDSPVPAGVEWASLIVERYRQCWQASRLAALEEAAKLCDEEWYLLRREECAEAIRELAAMPAGR